MKKKARGALLIMIYFTFISVVFLYCIGQAYALFAIYIGVGITIVYIIEEILLNKEL